MLYQLTKTKQRRYISNGEKCSNFKSRQTNRLFIKIIHIGYCYSWFYISTDKNLWPWRDNILFGQSSKKHIFNNVNSVKRSWPNLSLRYAVDNVKFNINMWVLSALEGQMELSIINYTWASRCKKKRIIYK